MNILGISPNIIFNKLIVNEDLQPELELSTKASTLSKDKINFIISIIDLIEKL